MVRAGFYGKVKIQRFKCRQCGERLSEAQPKPCGADVRLPKEKVRMILHCLVEGSSVRGTARLCDVEKRTVLSILKIAGEACGRALTERVRNVPVQDLELDEVWCFVRKKQANVRAGDGIRIGSAYTFIALERTSKQVV
jgi:hypothetical protein